MTPTEYRDFQSANAEKRAEFLAWLDSLIALGQSYAHFQSAGATHAQLKKVRRELAKLPLS